MDNYYSRRREEVRDTINGVTSNAELEEQQRAIRKEEERQMKKQRKKQEMEDSLLYQATKGVAYAMDKCFLDPLIGLIPGAGDFLTSLAGLPAFLMAAFKIRSLPLTLAVLYNTLKDTLLGMIPFYIGDIIDAFHRSNLKNFKLIQGFVDDDRQVINEVNSQATKMAILIAIVIFLIYQLFKLVGAMWDGITKLFS